MSHSFIVELIILKKEIAESIAEEKVAEKVISRSEVFAEKGRKFVPVVAHDSSFLCKFIIVWFVLLKQ